MTWNFVRFQEIRNQRDAKISDFYLDKQKSFIPKKILSVPCIMDSSFFSQQMAPWRPNFPHQRLWFRILFTLRGRNLYSKLPFIYYWQMIYWITISNTYSLKFSFSKIQINGRFRQIFCSVLRKLELYLSSFCGLQQRPNQACLMHRLKNAHRMWLWMEYKCQPFRWNILLTVSISRFQFLLPSYMCKIQLEVIQ